MFDVKGEARRSSIRIRYPEKEGPTFFALGASCPVLELSREAVVLPVVRQFAVAENRVVQAVLRFADGHALQITGALYRVKEQGLVVKFTQPLPASLYERELRRGSLVSDRRQYFRLRYPEHDIHYLRVLSHTFRLLEISEHGAVFFCPNPLAFHLGQALNVSITFHDNETVRISGTVLRMNSGEVVVYLPMGIPEERIAKEQLRVIRYLKER